MAAMEAANAHYHNGHHQQAGPPLPASPTLTNPDMILPDYDRSNSPDPDLDRNSHPALMMWNNAHTATSASDHHMFVATGMAGPHPYGPAGPITPTTPIIYGNGTMLSDIGEVTEVESTVGRPSPGRTRVGARGSESPKRTGSGEVAPRSSSPTIGAAAAMMKKSKQSLRAKRERRSSMESNSTITTEDRAAAVFADFDDSVSVGDSVFQGDDEESMASSYVEGTPAVEPARLGVAKVDNIDRLSTYSTTSLSRRAEEILANAKRRLTTMEGNLNRARSSLQYTSPPYGSDASTPSPPLQRAATAMYPRDDSLDPDSPPADLARGHARMGSEIAMGNGLAYRVSLPRSQSALGAAGGYRQPLTSSKSADQIRGDAADEPRRPVHRASSVMEAGLKPLTEDEVARLGEADSASQNARLEAFLSPTFGSFDSNAKTTQRSSSVAQMRDIKDQMRDLKGKISSLREQARADSLKRRSLQSLRTPSPFTHAQIDQWYAEPRSNRTSEIITSNVAGRNPWNGEESSMDGDVRDDVRQADERNEEEHPDYAKDGSQPLAEASDSLEAEPLSPSTPVAVPRNGVEEDTSDMLTENGDADEVQEDDFHDANDADYMSESGESLYHDTVQHQISHEDREDAFDYEHFFLHSALGTVSLTRRASTGSLTSEDSVETTRGPVANGTNSGDDRPDRLRAWSRRSSSNSISTIDTFATAQEARSLRSPVSLEEVHQQGLHGGHESSSRAASAQSHRYRSGSAATSKRLSFTTPISTRPSTSATVTRDSDGSISPIAEEGSSPAPVARNTNTHQPPSSSSASSSQPRSARRGSVIHRPISASLHRPSNASFDSVGTNRSFPLVNKRSSTSIASVASKKASSTGVLTPPRDDDAPDRELDLGSITSRLMNELQVHHHLHQTPYAQITGCGVTADADVDVDGDDAPRGEGTQPHPHPLEGLLREDRYLVERVVASLGRCVLGLTEHGRAGAESRMYRRRIDAARRALEGLPLPNAGVGGGGGGEIDGFADGSGVGTGEE